MFPMANVVLLGDLEFGIYFGMKLGGEKFTHVIIADSVHLFVQVFWIVYRRSGDYTDSDNRTPSDEHPHLF